MSNDAANIRFLTEDVLWLGYQYVNGVRDAVSAGGSSAERALLMHRYLSATWDRSMGGRLVGFCRDDHRRKVVSVAASVYPSDWIASVNANGLGLSFRNRYRLSTHPTHYYQPAQQRNVVVAHSTPDMVHELWHLFESSRASIGLVETEYRACREREGQPMFTPYAHKDCRSIKFTEVGSTAIEALVGGYTKQPDDEHLALVLGLMLAIRPNPTDLK